ncbi:hypothetical protein GCM10023148_07420 [Actinokineospora soli]
MDRTYLAEFDEPTGYLDFARFGPPSRAVVDASDRALRATARCGPSTLDDLMTADARARTTAARLCGGTPDRVVLVPNTSLGLLQAAFGVTGRVLVPTTDFPANTYPWARAEQAGRITVDRVPPEAITRALTPEHTAVAVSAVDFRTGYRMDLAALREAVGDRLLVVDGIQGFGAVDADWAAADVLVVGGQKWLRAGWGTGFAAFSERALDGLEPLLSSWTGARDPMVFDDEIHPPADGAARWGITNLSPIAATALAVALELVERVGVAAIAEGIGRRVGELADTVVRAGGRIVSRGPTMVAFATTDLQTTARSLADHGIAASVRADHIRLSPHASTTDDTVAAVAAALEVNSPQFRN